MRPKSKVPQSIRQKVICLIQQYVYTAKNSLFGSSLLTAIAKCLPISTIWMSWLLFPDLKIKKMLQIVVKAPFNLALRKGLKSSAILASDWYAWWMVCADIFATLEFNFASSNTEKARLRSITNLLCAGVNKAFETLVLDAVLVFFGSSYPDLITRMYPHSKIQNSEDEQNSLLPPSP